MMVVEVASFHKKVHFSKKVRLRFYNNERHEDTSIRLITTERWQSNKDRTIFDRADIDAFYSVRAVDAKRATYSRDYLNNLFFSLLGKKGDDLEEAFSIKIVELLLKRQGFEGGLLSTCFRWITKYENISFLKEELHYCWSQNRSIEKTRRSILALFRRMNSFSFLGSPKNCFSVEELQKILKDPRSSFLIGRILASDCCDK